MTGPVTILRNDPTVKSERKAFVEWYQGMIPQYQHNNIIFVDGNPFNLQILKSHGWVLVSETPNPVIPTSGGKNISMILALNSVNIIHREAIVGRGVHSSIFNEFIAKQEKPLEQNKCTQLSWIMCDLIIQILNSMMIANTK
ncbi:hypothetical protein RF11_05699 [Thelohanellus kitauei]|uniref:DDE-1 domain-containing protein n=1 Tax=Thelohanellus kitauei TaxID=669202 RepID=A0A0C2I6K0_THEKT|nr:hypothetical protein RF11_05699 [Thelohanellus kitauei]